MLKSKKAIKVNKIELGINVKSQEGSEGKRNLSMALMSNLSKCKKVMFISLVSNVNVRKGS